MKILIISTCKEELSELEFVLPVEDICKSADLKFATKHYSKVIDEDLQTCDKVILCGTALMDFDYLEDLEKFDWIKDFEKPVLGICSGMQIIAKVFGLELVDCEEIGEVLLKFDKEFLGLKDEEKVYCLHKKGIAVGDLKSFENFASSKKCAQAIKHKDKEVYATMFHPEVWNKSLIERFLANDLYS